MGIYLSSCAHKLVVESVPAGAQVFGIDRGGKRIGELGKTPVSLSTSVQTLEVAKTGYSSSFIELPDSSTHARYAVSLQKLSEATINKILFETQADVLNNALLDVLKMQNLINDGKIKEAEEFAKPFRQKYEYVSVFHVMIGHIELGKKNSKAARERFERALELDPKNDEARAMLTLIRGGK